ncbi:MAG: hypothetical protein RLZZ543_127 [Bacteroidota bacterium]
MIRFVRSTCLLLLLAGSYSLFAQQPASSSGELHGNFQMDAQYYNQDSLIGAPVVKEKILTNGFMNLWYTKGNFTAGLRYENYLNVMQGFDPRYKGSGIPFRFATYKNDNLEATVGNFYEQFGGGLILRAYEERGLGYDNAFDGVRVRYQPAKGLYLKGLIARQRTFFSLSPGIIRAFDAEVNVNELIPALANAKTSVIFGGSAVSRFQSDQDPIYNLPENVAAFAGRMNVIRGKFNLQAEYGYKYNDPNATNSMIYHPGQALSVTSTYSAKGFGLLLAAKRLDNFDFRSDRTAAGIGANVNFLPALTRQHTYNLPATIYPYATQPNGEMGFQAELSYRLKKGSKLGGKYGTEITINFSGTNGIVKNPTDNDTLGYTSPFFQASKTMFFRDFHVEIHRKFNAKWKATVMYLNWVYNKDVVQGLSGFGTIFANMGVLDVAYKINAKNTIRVEAQSLLSKQDLGSWAMGMIEYTFAPNWFVAVLDQYNYGNPDPIKQIHYITGNTGYTKNGNRIMLQYGRQRAGIFCVGGVCRNVPASNGFSISITSSF